MKNKIKKIITTTVISAVSLTAIGCATNNKIACGSENCKNMVARSTDLEILDNASAKAPTPARNIGKIVETSTNENGINIYNTKNGLTYLNENISETDLENSLINKNEKFNLFILSSTPYISLTSDDTNSLNLNIKLSKVQTIETSREANNQNNTYNLKRSILMIYVNELSSGNITLSNENKTLINTHLETIKNNENNYELKTRAIDSIINILESNLRPTSKYYNSNLSENYNTLITKFNNVQDIDKITEQSTNEQIANKIACTLNFCNLNINDIIEQKTNNTQLQRSSTINSLNNSQNTQIQAQNNQSSTQEFQNNNTYNNQNSINSNNGRYRRIPSSVRQRRMNNQNNTINSSSLDIKQEEHRMNSTNQNQLNTNQNLNNSRSIMENSKTMRAERTPENLSNEEYSASSTYTNEPRATRVPYSSSSNNFQR